jgi:drug/metabolite transporter (DMT)-like permease
LIGLRWLRHGGAGRRDPAGGAVIAGNALACMAALPFALPLGDPGASDAAWILYLGGIQIALAYRLATAALRALPAVQASLLLMVEPALNPAWTWGLHGERPAALALAGGALIAAAAAWHALGGSSAADNASGK